MMPEIDYINPNYVPVYKARLELIQKIRASAETLAAFRVHYLHNPIDFISDWLVTYDPRSNPAFMPFVLWPKQAEYIQWLRERYQRKEDGLVEKSRDAGATYLNAAFALWLWLFESGSKVSFGSRKEALVDKMGDPDTIFEKIRIMLRELPVEFLPEGYDERRHATFMKFVNPQNGSTITGEAGDNIGRGGRSGVYFKDESAFYERPELIDAALSQNSDVKIDVSTPNGNGNPFWKKRFSGKIPVFVFDWRDDPRKDDTWYQKQKDTLEPWILAQEVDRDYNASVEGICIPARYVQAAINLDIPANGGTAAGLDVADEGGDSNALIIRRGVRVTHIEAWKYGDTTETSRHAVLTCDAHQVDLINYDSIGVGAGVKGELKSLKERITSEGRFFPAIAGVNSGSAELLDMYSEDRTEKDMFLNRRASMWWRMRRRFERTYEYFNGIKDWPVDELISIPADQELISELSQPLREITDSGKIRIESKAKMLKRGIKSPNKADALMLCFENPELLSLSLDSGPQRSVSDATRIQEYITGKTTTPPWMQDRSSGHKYIDFGE